MKTEEIKNLFNLFEAAANEFEGTGVQQVGEFWKSNS
jgi:hypothetical protein